MSCPCQEQEYLANTKTLAKSDNSIWKKADPKQVLGLVCPDEVLGMLDNERNRKVAYARTTIDSTEARQATF
jgi:hypothetical protein